jgi:hypothetical protein
MSWRLVARELRRKAMACGLTRFQKACFDIWRGSNPPRQSTISLKEAFPLKIALNRVRRNPSAGNYSGSLGEGVAEVER